MNFLHSEADAGPGDVVRVHLELRLIRRSLQQLERVMRVNGLSAASEEAVEVARESLVIGTY